MTKRISVWSKFAVIIIILVTVCVSVLYCQSKRTIRIHEENINNMTFTVYYRTPALTYIPVNVDMLIDMVCDPDTGKKIIIAGEELLSHKLLINEMLNEPVKYTDDISFMDLNIYCILEKDGKNIWDIAIGNNMYVNSKQIESNPAFYDYIFELIPEPDKSELKDFFDVQ